MVTIRDVAKHAGVSISTVSRVINNYGYVTKEKKELVRKAVEELGYTPKTIEIAERNGDLSKQILFLNKDYSNPFTMEMYRGMVDYAWNLGYMVAISGTWEPHRVKELKISGIIFSNEVEAIEFDNTFHEIVPIPAVAASHGSSMLQPRHLPYVECNTFNAMEVLLDYLIEKGHTKIGLATPYYPNETNPRGVAYLMKMSNYLKEKTKEYVFCPSVYYVDHSGKVDFIAMGEDIAGRIAGFGPELTAVACFNDDIAVGVIKGLTKEGISVPDDISVISIGGIESIRYYCPELTSVLLHAYDQGKECAKVLIDMIDRKSVPRITKITPGKIVGGDSVSDISKRK